MVNPTFQITGKVIDRLSQLGIPDLHVEAWDKDLLFDDCVAKAVTDNAGCFQMEFGESGFAELFFEQRPDLYFKVYREQILLWSSENSVLWNIASGSTLVTIEVDAEQPSSTDGALEKIRESRKLLAQMAAAEISIKLNACSGDVKNLHTVLTALDYAIPQYEIISQTFGVGTEWAIRQFQSQHGLEVTGLFDSPTQAALEEVLADSEIPQSVVQGRLIFDDSLVAAGITLRLYLHEIGGPGKQSVSEFKTDSQGFFFLVYIPRGKSSNIEIRALDLDGKEISLTATKFNAAKHEMMNLVVPAKGVRAHETRSEFQRLTQDLAVPLGDWGKLADIREIPGQRDITRLRQTTGWDARLIALASAAVKLSLAISSDPAIPDSAHLTPSALYGLFRAGLPREKDLLARVNLEKVNKALVRVKEAGIVSEAEIGEASEAFQRFIGVTRRTLKGFGSLSSVGDFLDLRAGTGVGEGERLTEGEKQAFEELYFSHQGTAEDLWKKVAALDISPRKIDGLKLQGKLAYLTQNNALLTHFIQQRIGVAGNLGNLVTLGLHSGTGWENEIRQLAKEQNLSLDNLIPSNYLDDDTEDRLKAYAANLARKVHLSFPTRVVRHMIDKGEISLMKGDVDLKTPVGKFLGNADSLGFKFGRESLASLLETHTDSLFDGIPSEQRDKTTAKVKQLDRLYRISPTDQSFKALCNHGFGSAYEVACITQKVFVQHYGLDFNDQNLRLSRQTAVQIHQKAQHISAVTLNQFVMASQLVSMPGVYAISGSQDQRKTEMDALTKLIPTVNSLFGSLDYCECEHCRSVLSPAAYFVDLLQFIDPKSKTDEGEWEMFLKQWQWNPSHSLVPYPFDNPADAIRFDSHKEMTPYEVLIERRPDIPYLQLTCENTNTALPYIDLVNEILEYYVEYNKKWKDLGDKAVRNTGEATTDELLAEPHNIIPDVYATLNQAVYPLSLPFDLSLDTVRKFFDYFETPLWQVMKTFRQTEVLFTASNLYGWSDIFSEYLGLSPAEYGIFTATEAQWGKIYGFTGDPEQGTVASFAENQQSIDLTSAKTLAQRLGVTYLELDELLSTGFITGWATTGGHTTLLFQWPDTLIADFDGTTVNYGDRSLIDAPALIRLNLFVRLWKKLGWPIEDVDNALHVFLPEECRLKTGDKLSEGLKTALVYLAHLKALDERLKLGKKSRPRLLALWSDLGTWGKNSLYKQLFLTRSILKDDEVFSPNKKGEYLPGIDDLKQKILLKDHQLPVQAALVLNTNEIEAILTDIDSDIEEENQLRILPALISTPEEIDPNLENIGLSLKNVKLSLAVVSKLHRYGFLAKALKLSVRELISLKQLSGLNPFMPITKDPLTGLEQDYPFTQTLRFVEVVDAIKDSGFGIEDLEYLLLNQVDPTGKYRENPSTLLALVKSLATGIRRIRDEHAAPTEALTFTDDCIRKELALLAPPDVVETFLSMWTGKVEYDAMAALSTQSSSGDPNVFTVAQKLEPGDYAQEPAISRVLFDEIKSTQHLVFRGVLLEASLAELKKLSGKSISIKIKDF